jgi:hypothetical protein
MVSEKIVIYGLSTEGYSLACQMAVNGADVQIIDETSSSAMSLTSEIAQTYPSINSLKEDEPLLSMEPIEIAVSNAKYLFFTPKIRKMDQDLKTELNSKFKDAVESLKKGSNLIYCLGTGFGGNNENISILEHVTGFKAGKSISYFYFPVNDSNQTPTIIGSFNNTDDKKLASFLATDKEGKKFVSISTAEQLHAIDTVKRFTSICSIVEICDSRKFQRSGKKSDLDFTDFKNLYLDDMINGLYDLRSIASSFEGVNSLMYLINGCLKGISSYIKRLIDIIRITLKKNDLKASRTKIILSWTFDLNGMRGEKIEILDLLTSKLRDYIGDVETSQKPEDIFRSDKKTIVIVCSKYDYKKIKQNQRSEDFLVIKANSLCEVEQ